MEWNKRNRQICVLFNLCETLEMLRVPMRKFHCFYSLIQNVCVWAGPYANVWKIFDELSLKILVISINFSRKATFCFESHFLLVFFFCSFGCFFSCYVCVYKRESIRMHVKHEWVCVCVCVLFRFIWTSIAFGFRLCCSTTFGFPTYMLKLLKNFTKMTNFWYNKPS